MMKGRMRWAFLLAGAFLLYGAVRNPISRLNKRSGSTSSVPARPTPRVPALYVNSVVQHGRIVEIKGTTDPRAVVMINGERAAVIFDGNAFRHFLGPLPKGTTIVSITSQNEDGGVKTQKIAVNID